MRLGLFHSENDLDRFVARCRTAADAGFASVWTSQVSTLDALTAIAVAGREVDGIRFGTGVVPTYPRHPMMLAQQALTAQAATGGRLSLGIGLSHQVVVEGMWGYDFSKPARHMREYLSVLLPLAREGKVAFEGETVKGMGQVDVQGAAPFPVLLAALAPRMLHLAGAVADGTVTWMTGPATIAEHIVPSITRAAEEAGREQPTVVCALPVAVTDDPGAARDLAARTFAVYGQLPSYRAMLDREGAAGPADVAIVGDEATVRAQIERTLEGGATEFVAAPFTEQERTIDFLQTLL